MPRKPAHTPEHLIETALAQFWAHGFSATSIDDLVRATGVSRHGLYAAHRGKERLFAAIFDHYDKAVVSPALAQIEEAGATLDAVESYFEAQISRAEEGGLPGPGCLVVNTQSEPAAQSPAVRGAIAAHRARLLAGFENAIHGEAPDLVGAEQRTLAQVLLVSAQGLWTASRVVDDAEDLRAIARTSVDLIRERISDV